MHVQQHDPNWGHGRCCVHVLSLRHISEEKLNIFQFWRVSVERTSACKIAFELIPQKDTLSFFFTFNSWNVNQNQDFFSFFFLSNNERQTSQPMWRAENMATKANVISLNFTAQDFVRISHRWFETPAKSHLYFIGILAIFSKTNKPWNAAYGRTQSPISRLWKPNGTRWDLISQTSWELWRHFSCTQLQTPRTRNLT